MRECPNDLGNWIVVNASFVFASANSFTPHGREEAICLKL